MKPERDFSFEGKYDGHTYPIHIVGRHVEITDAMRAYAIEKLDRVTHFGLKIKDVLISMDVQKMSHTVNYVIDLAGVKIKVHGTTDTMYSAIDQAAGRLESKLRQYHERITEHHQKPIEEVEANVTILAPISTEEANEEIEEETERELEELWRPHEVVSKQIYHLKMLTQPEAVMKMDLSSDPFLIYRSENDQKLKVIYRLENGNYGIIEPER